MKGSGKFIHFNESKNGSVHSYKLDTDNVYTHLTPEVGSKLQMLLDLGDGATHHDGVKVSDDRLKEALVKAQQSNYDTNYVVNITEDDNISLNVIDKSIMYTEQSWEGQKKRGVKNKGLTYYDKVRKDNSTMSMAGDDSSPDKSIAVIIENIGDAIHDFLNEGNITYEFILTIRLIVHSYCHLYGYEKVIDLVWKNLAIAVLYKEFQGDRGFVEEADIIEKLEEKYKQNYEKLKGSGVTKGNNKRIAILLGMKSNSPLEDLRDKISSLAAPADRSMENLFFISVIYERMSNKSGSIGKYLENQLKRFIYDELLHNCLLINPTEKQGKLQVEAVLKHDYIEKLEFITSYETGSEDGAGVWRKFMGLGNLSLDDNRELILKTINFPINDSIVEPTYEHLEELDSFRIQGSNCGPYTSDGPAFIEKFPEYSLWRITTHPSITSEQRRKAMIMYRNIFIKNYDGEDTRSLHSVYFPFQKIYNTTDAGSPSGLEALRDRASNPIFGREGYVNERESVAQKCDEATAKLGIVRNDNFQGDGRFPKDFILSNRETVSYNKALESDLNVTHLFENNNDNYLLVNQKIKSDNPRLQGYIDILNNCKVLYKYLLNNFRRSEGSKYFDSSSGQLNVKDLIKAKYIYLKQFITVAETRAKAGGQLNDMQALYMRLKHLFNITNKFISDKKKKIKKKEDGTMIKEDGNKELEAGITPSVSNWDRTPPVAQDNLISFYDTELGGFLAKGMDGFLHPYLKEGGPKEQVNNTSAEYEIIQTSPFYAAATWYRPAENKEVYENLKLFQCLTKKFPKGIAEPKFATGAGKNYKTKPSVVATKRVATNIKLQILREFLETNYTIERENVPSAGGLSNDSVLFKLLYNLFCFDFEAPQSDIPGFLGW